MELPAVATAPHLDVPTDEAEPTATDEAEPTADIDAIEALLDEVGHALARLDDGTYGRCGACGGPIEDDRLAAQPTARTCRGCPTPAT